MSSATTAYALPTNPGFLTHGWGTPQLLRDADAPDASESSEDWAKDWGYNQTDAMAASGDCFITLATKLDLLAQSFPRDSSEQIEIENIVTTLFYLQTHYTVVANHKL